VHMLQHLTDEIPGGLGADPALHGQLVETVEKKEEALFAGVRIEWIAREQLGKPHVVADGGGERAGHVELVEGDEENADALLLGGARSVHPQKGGLPGPRASREDAVAVALVGCRDPGVDLFLAADGDTPFLYP